MLSKSVLAAIVGLMKRGGGGDVNLSGGKVYDSAEGDLTTVRLRNHGVTGSSTIKLGGIACTNIVVIDADNFTVEGPSDDLKHGTTYSLEIS
ncbi:MAG TPA: hypothetical protein ENI26_01865 [Methylophaga aminisulfidivorans]|uniref:Uncharacterized protein n=1 Tax=Methylophaga aminisulfidivorans TaxID=230105 RepID=A0A7C1VVW3_9GAMM|nr:hypothetical protein [Methylophaga aminisulfidivorans]